MTSISLNVNLLHFQFSAEFCFLLPPLSIWRVKLDFKLCFKKMKKEKIRHASYLLAFVHFFVLRIFGITFRLLFTFSLHFTFTFDIASHFTVMVVERERENRNSIEFSDLRPLIVYLTSHFLCFDTQTL